MLNTCKPQDSLFTIANIRKCEKYVLTMQKRLDEAVASNDYEKIKSIFNILIRRSQAVRILAIYRITYLNSGKNTAGVDREAIPKGKGKIETDKLRNKLLKEIDIKKKPDKIRRVYIPKPNGKKRPLGKQSAKRPLGIPTLKDRIIQEIYRMALEPIAEYRFHDNSYGFRPKRSCHDAVDMLHKCLGNRTRKRYIVEGDIKSCFDYINHDYICSTLKTWLIPNHAINTIRKMLKSKILDNGIVKNSTEGTPQGGVISPLLANVALTGLDHHVAEKFGTISYHGGKHWVSPMIRYADDFVIFCRSKFQAKTIKAEITDYLHKHVGLTLSDEKTCITHIKKGFDFLGFTLKKYPKPEIRDPKGIEDYTLLITPTRDSINKILLNCKEVLDSHKQVTQEVIIKLLNPKLQGWGLYYKYSNSKQFYNKIDYAMWHKLNRWTKRRHSNKGKKWIYKKYFISDDGSRHFSSGNLKLTRLSSIPIERYAKAEISRRVYRKQDQEYWDKLERKRMFRKLFTYNKHLFQKQKGICAYCKNPFTTVDRLHRHHVTPKASGGTDDLGNLQILHYQCHRELHRKPLSNLPEHAENL